MPATRDFSARVLCLLTFLLGCATAQPAESPPAPPPAPAGPHPAPLPVATPQPPPGRGEAASVDGAEGLTRLCESLRDEASLTFPGTAVEQARASEAHAQRRQAVLRGNYVTVVPPGGYGFRNYDLGERRLVLDGNRSLVLGEGAELFITSQDEVPGFALGPDLADRLLSQHAAGKVALRLVFRPVSSPLRNDACVWLGGGRVVKLGVEVAAAALVGLDGTVLARADTGDYADGSLGVPVRAPKVTVRTPRTAGGKDVPASQAAAFSVLAARALPCYERVLIVRPDLRGTLVLAIRIGAGGRVEAPHVEMSSLGDDALTSCVSSGATKATISGASAGQRFSVPLQFGSADD
jgi:hypothetical protein